MPETGSQRQCLESGVLRHVTMRAFEFVVVVDEEDPCRPSQNDLLTWCGIETDRSIGLSYTGSLGTTSRSCLTPMLNEILAICT